MITSSDGLELIAAWSEDSPVTMRLRVPGEAAEGEPTQPLVEALAAGHGRNWAGRRYVTTSIGQRLRYRGHHLERDGAWQTLSLTQLDEVTGLEFVSVLSMHDQHRAVRGLTRVRNVSTEPVTLQAVSSLVFADFPGCDSRRINAMTLLHGRNDWLAEGRWVEEGLRAAGLPDLTEEGRPVRSRGCVEASNTGSWSTGYDLPSAVVRDPGSGRGWSFQIEHNGSWLWQVGELADGLYLALLGPTDEQHQWWLELARGETFESVPASLALEDGTGGPIDELTGFRRLRPAGARRGRLPVVFNDYMNTVNGDPRADILHPLIDAAAQAGAEIFVIDAGWYANGADWWDSVGEWQPSIRRFPRGIEDVLDHIRGRGMVPGLWLEPEVIGINGPLAGKLPDAAFLRRDEVRVSEHGRYHLDLTDPAAIGFLDGVVDRLVNDYGVGYFKFDYNIRAGAGSNANTPSAGHGLLLHNRGYLTWIDELRRRHPALMLENCASGGMRQDHATVSRFDLQSTSDQEDAQAYAPIAAAAPMSVLPEQAGNWAYPQPEMSDQEITFTLCAGVLGRLYLSGWLDRLNGGQASIVAEAVHAHKLLRDRMPSCAPFWPLGLPGWQDEWVVLGLRDADGTVFLTIWRRGHAAGHVSIELPAAPDGHQWSAPAAVFPAASPLSAVIDADRNTLGISDTSGQVCARVLSLTPLPSPKTYKEERCAR